MLLNLIAQDSKYLKNQSLSNERLFLFSFISEGVFFKRFLLVMLIDFVYSVGL